MLQESIWHYEIRTIWPHSSAILILRLETLLVTPVNLTRKKIWQIIQFPGLGARSQSQKTAFYRGHFRHCEVSYFWRCFFFLRSFAKKCKIRFSAHCTALNCTAVLSALNGQLIRMQHWRRPATDGAEFWISCNQLKELRKAGRLQTLQNKSP